MTSQRVYPRGEGGYNTSLEKTPAAHHVDEDDYGKTPEHMGKYSSIAKYKDDAAKAGDVSSLGLFRENENQTLQENVRSH